MARIADYTIITDAWVIQADQDTIEFPVPDNINLGARSILGFMLDVDNVGELRIKMRLNGHEVWSWHYSDGSQYPVRFFQEVIGANVLKAGTNVLSFDGASGEKWFAQISDAVLWVQVNI
jgi:hypothetical protein